jgi:hypothetical protein
LLPAEKLSRALILGTPNDPRAAVKAQVRRFVVTWSLLVGMGCLTVSAFAGTAAHDYQIDRLTSAYRAAVQENLELKAEATALGGPVRLLAEAERLRYVAPTQELVVRVAAPGRPAGGPPSFWRRWADALARLKGVVVRALMAF